jgi:small subunit ribosomal protein S9
MSNNTKTSFIHAVGRRKRAVASIRFFPGGEGKITVNKREFTNYFPTALLQQIVLRALEAVGKSKDFDVVVVVKGGGIHGQADAVALGIARALVLHETELRTTIKKLGFLRRDSRKKERKKPGLKRARRAPQFSKR